MILGLNSNKNFFKNTHPREYVSVCAQMALSPPLFKFEENESYTSNCMTNSSYREDRDKGLMRNPLNMSLKSSQLDV